MPLTSSNLPFCVSHVFNPPVDLLDRLDTPVTQFYDWSAVHNPDYPLFVYHDGKQRQYVTYSSAVTAMDRAGRYVISRVSSSPKTGPLPRVVGILANADTITYICTVLGVLKAGCTAFVISTRNAPVAVADMLKRTGAYDILVSSDPSMQDLASEVASILSRDSLHVVVHPMPMHEELFRVETSPLDLAPELPKTLDMKAPAIIMHSSGSTGHPKPITWTHSSLSSLGQATTISQKDVTGHLIGAHGSPMFHALGTYLHTAAPMTGMIIAVFKPASPPIVPTPDAVWDGIKATEADYSFSVPSFIEQWARDPEKIVSMKKMRGLIYGGARLHDDVGDSLAAQGIALYPVYGCTEVGIMNIFVGPHPGMDWSYWTPSPEHKLVFKPVSEGLYEIIALSDPEMPLPKCNAKEGEWDAYATNDLVMAHPSKADKWKIVARADDQIILSNGEKTNPVPLEKIIDEDPHVHMSIIFGQGKFQNGVIVEPAQGNVVDPGDMRQVAEYRNAIWPTIERMNEYAPQHSRIFKEMILIATPSKPFHLTAKGTLRRNLILSDYEDEIEAIYQAVETSAESDIPPPTTWDEDGIKTFVRAVVHDTLNRAIEDDADIFRNGGDSLQATWIRNTLRRAVSENDAAAAQRISPNLVFAFPSISTLAQAVYDVVHGTDSASAGARTPADLWKYVERYSAALPARPANLAARPAGAKDVVLITGTTGGFGCDALEHLLRDPRVERVYAFNRKGSQAAERQRAQFRARGLDETFLDSEKYVMVESVLHEPGFGIAPELLEEIRGSVTHIMLNAWRVNFNMSIASFEVDMQGVRNFVELALSSPYTAPPTVVFVSSIGVFNNYSGPSPVPEAPLDDPVSPFGSGYSESKWVMEHTLQNVTEHTDVHTVVVRLGQVSGDKLGYWNEKEWFPSLVKSALYQHCLPTLEGDISWFPAYEAAKAFTEMRHSREAILHIVHPRPVSWRTVLAPITEELHVPFASYDAWLAALEQGGADDVEAMRANPALRLLPFFRATKETMVKDSEGAFEPMGMVRLSTAKATTVSDALKGMPQLDAERALSWVAAWKKSGFL